MDNGIMKAFSVRASSNIGQVVLDPDGKMIAWTTDLLVAQVIARVLNRNEELLFVEKENIDETIYCRTKRIRAA